MYFDYMDNLLHVLTSRLKKMPSISSLSTSSFIPWLTFFVHILQDFQIPTLSMGLDPTDLFMCTLQYFQMPF
jgi:hypothetical protein